MILPCYRSYIRQASVWGWDRNEVGRSGWKLEINRDKTRVIRPARQGAKSELSSVTHFAGGIAVTGMAALARYLHVGPSKKALQREQDKLTAMTGQSSMP